MLLMTTDTVIDIIIWSKYQAFFSFEKNSAFRLVAAKPFRFLKAWPYAVSPLPDIPITMSFV